MVCAWERGHHYYTNSIDSLIVNTSEWYSCTNIVSTVTWFIILKVHPSTKVCFTKNVDLSRIRNKIKKLVLRGDLKRTRQHCTQPQLQMHDYIVGILFLHNNTSLTRLVLICLLKHITTVFAVIMLTITPSTISRVIFVHKRYGVSQHATPKSSCTFMKSNHDSLILAPSAGVFAETVTAYSGSLAESEMFNSMKDELDGRITILLYPHHTVHSYILNYITMFTGSPRGAYTITG